MLEKIINNHKNHLSPRHKYIAEKILNKPEDYVRLPISKCSKKLGVSNSTLSRFVKAIELEDYSELQELVSSYLLSVLSPKQKMKATLSRIEPFNNRVVEEIFKDIEYLSYTLQTIDSIVINEIVDLLTVADTIYIIGLGVSRSVALFMEFRLRRMGFKHKVIITGGYEMLEQLSYIQPKDVLFSISFQRSYDEIISGILYAKEKNVPTIAISENVVSPIASNVDVLLPLMRGPKDQLNSLAVPISVCNAILLELNYHKREQAIHNLDNIEALSQKYKLNMEENNNE